MSELAHKFLKVVLCSLLIVQLGCSQRSIKLPELEEQSMANFELPEIREHRLQNGLRLLHAYDDEVPLVTAKLYMPGGSAWEPNRYFGSVDAMGSMLRFGGTQELSPDQLDLELQKLSASVSSGFGSEYGTVAAHSLADDFPTVLKYMADVTLQPRFDRSRLKLWKSQSLEGIARRADDPSTIASIVYSELVFGSNNPFGRVISSEQIQNITEKTVRDAYQRFVQPDGAILVVSGAVSFEEVRSLVEKEFSGWRSQQSEELEKPEFNYTASPGIYFVQKDFSQATISMGHPGPERHTPLKFAFSALNEIFGSGFFSSRLMLKIRTELGLAYWIYGGVSPGFVVGDVSVRQQTKAESAGDAVVTTLKELKRIISEPVTEEELAAAKRGLLQSFVFRFDTTDEVIQRRAMLDLLGYPSDFDDIYVKKVSEMTDVEILEAAKATISPNDLVIVVVGGPEAERSVRQAVLNNQELFPPNFQFYRVNFGESERVIKEMSS